MKNIKSLFIIIIILFTNLSFSQEKEEKILKKADDKFENFAYIDAQKVYLDVAKSGYESENLFKRLGDSYYFNNNLSEALIWYEKLYNFKNQKLENEYLFRYGMCLKNAERYDEADQILSNYKGNLGVNTDKTEKNKDYYLNIINLQKDRFSIGATNFNSEHLDFSPTFYNNNIVFSSNRVRSVAQTDIDAWTKNPFIDLYITDSLGTETTLFSKKINSTFHDSSPVFTKDGNTIYFTRNNYREREYKKKKREKNLLKIYKATKTGESWSQPEELPFNNDSYSCAHPALNKEENRLYFSSDLPGTVGNSDIFFVTINGDNTYGEPQNLGSEINTKERETFPHINNNLLYFSSEGHYGLGGLDIFVAELNEETNYIGEPLNIGEPINSPSDDISFIINNETKTGYFASNRDGGSGEDDIYKLKQLKNLITGCKQTINGIVSENDTQIAIPNTKVTLYDEALNELETVYTDSQGKYEFIVACNKKYNVRVAVNGFESTESHITTGNDFEGNTPLDVLMNQGDDLGMVKVMEGDDLAKSLQLDMIYFDFNKSNIRQDAQVELQKIAILLQNNPEIDIDVRSHTDSRGKPNYNLNLSNERAISTVNYLRNQNIATYRINGRGYGDTQLVNYCSEGVVCTEEQHQENRRSEFIIMTKNLSVNKITTIQDEYENTVVAQPIIVDHTTNNSNYNDSVSTNSVSYYGFSAYDTEIYSIQIGAFKAFKENRYNFEDVFYHKYNDGVTRYFAGIFTTREEANAHKKYLESQNIKGFVVKLQGENRN